MHNTREAIELTTNLSRSALDEPAEDGYPEFAMDVAAKKNTYAC